MEEHSTARFTSAKCPPGQGLEYSCELPFGFIWTPLAPASNVRVISCDDTATTTTTEQQKGQDQLQLKQEEAAASTAETTPEKGTQLPPIMCLSCLSYLNLFAEIQEQTWTCPFCEAKNVIPPTALGGALAPILSVPTVELRQTIASSSGYSQQDSTTLILVLDAHLPCEQAHAVGTMIQNVLFSSSSSKDKDRLVINLGLIIFAKNVSIYQLGVSGMASCDVFATQRGLTEDYLKEKSYLKTIRTAADLECLWRCLAAQYGAPDDEEAEDATGKHTSRTQLLRERKEARLRKQQQQQASNEQQHSPSFTSTKSPWTAAREDAPWTQTLRCTGEAVQCAVDLASMMPVQPQPRTARVLLFTNGCPSFGHGSTVLDPDETTLSKYAHNKHKKMSPVAASHPHHEAPYAVDSHELVRSKEYFDLLAKTAAEGGVGFDVLCTGASELAIPAYQALVEPSSGYVLSHDSFTSPHLEHNVNFLWHRTFMSGIYAEETPDMNWIDGCIVDLRMAGFVEPTHLVGTGEFMESKKTILANERTAFVDGCALAAQAGLSTRKLPVEEMIAGSLTRVRLGRYDPLSTFSVMLQLHDLLPEDDEHAIFQFIARFVDQDGTTLVTRISTHRLAIAKDVSEFLDSVDEEVVPVLLGKESVYRSMYGREVDDGRGGKTTATDVTDHVQLEKLAYDAQTDIDATIQNISGAYRLLGLEEGMTRGMDLSEEGKTRAMGSSMDFAFPPELSGALRRIYHLRRGPLISPGPLQSRDDRAEKRSLFVRLPLQQCLAMMAPSVWSSGPLDPDNDDIQARLSETVPPETLVLWRNCVIAADFYESLFVWSGEQTKGASYDEVRRQFHELLLEQSKDRFPKPTIHVVSERDSMSRRFTSLLSPSHADPIQHQVAHFPALEHLSDEELTHLRSKFRFHDPNVDPSFRQWFWDVSSAASKGQGVSLCE